MSATACQQAERLWELLSTELLNRTHAISQKIDSHIWGAIQRHLREHRTAVRGDESIA
jgi:hypothetical protein